MDDLEKLIDYIDEKEKDADYDIDHRFSDGYKAALRHVRNRAVYLIMNRTVDFVPHP